MVRRITHGEDEELTAAQPISNDIEEDQEKLRTLLPSDRARHESLPSMPWSAGRLTEKPYRSHQPRRIIRSDTAPNSGVSTSTSP